MFWFTIIYNEDWYYQLVVPVWFIFGTYYMHKNQEHHKIIDYILNEVEDGRLIEGSRLPSERELSDQLGTSRNVTREAISILRGTGLIESRPGSGNYIVDNADKTVRRIVGVMFKMGYISTGEILSFRRMISRTVGTELIEKGISPEYEEKINNILIEMQDASEEEYCQLDREFHILLINATENVLFKKLMEPVWELYLDMIVDVIKVSTDEERKALTKMHENIFRSIQNKDATACIKNMKEHYDYVESRLSK